MMILRIVRPMSPAILMLRETQLVFLCDLGLYPRMRYRPGLEARLNALGTVYRAAHGLCRHDIAGFCEAYSLQAPWLGCKSAEYEVGPRACGRNFYAFWPEKGMMSWLFGAQWQSWHQMEK